MKKWILRTSPHNEDYILVIGKSKRDLAEIAEMYVREFYDNLGWIKASVDLIKGEVAVEWGYEKPPTDLDGSQTLYISEVIEHKPKEV